MTNDERRKEGRKDGKEGRKGRGKVYNNGWQQMTEGELLFVFFIVFDGLAIRIGRCSVVWYVYVYIIGMRATHIIIIWIAQNVALLLNPELGWMEWDLYIYIYRYMCILITRQQQQQQKTSMIRNVDTSHPHTPTHTSRRCNHTHIVVHTRTKAASWDDGNKLPVVSYISYWSTNDEFCDILWHCCRNGTR